MNTLTTAKVRTARSLTRRSTCSRRIPVTAVEDEGCVPVRIENRGGGAHSRLACNERTDWIRPLDRALALRERRRALGQTLVLPIPSDAA